MTEPKDPVRGDPLISGRPADAWLAEHRQQLVDRALETLERVEPRTAAESAQLRWMADVNLGLFVRFISGDEPADHDTAQDLVDAAASRAADGLPIENLLDDYLSGTAAMWEALAEQVRPEDVSALVELTGRLFAYLSRVVTLVLRGFALTAADMSTGERDARFAVYSALLSDAGHAAVVANRSGIVLAEEYAVLALRLGADDGDQVPDRRAPVPRVRRTTTVHRLLADLAGGDVLALVGELGGTALVPLDAAAADHVATIDAWSDRLSDALGVPVWVAVAIAVVADVPEAVTVTADVLELVEAVGHAPGAWTLDDVLVPYQLTRPGPARDRLAARMSSLEQHPDWEATLRAYLAAGADRQLTARTLHVHPNTVDYRLGRAAALCGFDAADPLQRPIVMAALAVLDLDRHTRQRPVPPTASSGREHGRGRP